MYISPLRTAFKTSEFACTDILLSHTGKSCSFKHLLCSLEGNLQTFTKSSTLQGTNGRGLLPLLPPLCRILRSNYHLCLCQAPHYCHSVCQAGEKWWKTDFFFLLLKLTFSRALGPSQKSASFFKQINFLLALLQSILMELHAFQPPASFPLLPLSSDMTDSTGKEPNMKHWEEIFQSSLDWELKIIMKTVSLLPKPTP